MSYTIRKYNGTQLVVLEDGTIDTSTSVALVGRNYTGYGELQNQNFLYLLENFANDAPPPIPVAGQTWFNTQNNNLNVHDGSKWNLIGTPEVSITAPENPSLGAFWLESANNRLYCWIGEWIFIGPENVAGFGKTRAETTTLLSDAGARYPVIIVYINDTVQSIFSSNSFTISSVERPLGFTNLIVGLNFPDRNNEPNVQGNLQGLADRATILDTTRSINGIGFNGSKDISITAPTPELLIPGNYISGNGFNGSSVVTWDIDATPNNTIGTVVARDSAGDFSAGTITATLVGNVQGNVTIAQGTSSFDIVTANQFVGASLTGNANTATRLRTARTINGVSFDGTQDVIVPVSGENVTGTRLANNVVNSNLSTVGTLSELRIDDAGMSIGNVLNLLVDSGAPKIKIDNSQGINIGVQDTSIVGGYSSVDFISASKNLSLGGEFISTIIPKNTLNLGETHSTFNKIHSTTFIGDLQGNSTTSTSSVTATNLAGGAGGAIPYQSAAGTTNFVPAGIAGQVLRSGGSGEPVWGFITFSTLSRGNYLTGSNYDGFVTTTWSVDATPSNIGNKVVARDSNGDFSARIITASLSGNVTGNVNGNLTGSVTGNVSGNATTATRLQTARTINGVSFNGTSNITIVDSTKAPIDSPTLTGSPRSTTPSPGDNSTRIATTAFVQQILSEPIWAGTTTLANVISTYSNNATYPIGTRVAYWETRSQTLFGGNGSATFSDYYRRVVKKINNSNGWIDVGG